MKKVLGIAITVLAIFMLVGCSCSLDDKKPEAAVDTFFEKYRKKDDSVMSQLKDTIESLTLDDDYKVKYQELMEKQYNQMAYVIKDVEENEDTANANVEITVLDYKSSIQESEKYLENNPDKFKDELGNYSEELFTKYKIDQMKLVDSTTTYNLNLKLTKENGMWTVNKLSDEDILKIHGMY